MRIPLPDFLDLCSCFFADDGKAPRVRNKIGGSEKESVPRLYIPYELQIIR